MCNRLNTAKLNKNHFVTARTNTRVIAKRQFNAFRPMRKPLANFNSGISKFFNKFRMMNRTIPNAKRIMIDACKECINGYLKDIDGRTDNVRIALAYTGVDLTDINGLKKDVEEEFPGVKLICDPLSLSVSCHIGPGAIAVAVSKAIPEDK